MLFLKCSMLLRDDLPNISDVKDAAYDYFITLSEPHTLFRVDDDTGILTDHELAEYFHLVDIADRLECEQFLMFKIFEPVLRSGLTSKPNLVDCVWIRKWAVKLQSVKSRLCARGCFDVQKHLIDKHSSTASRLSQRLICSRSMINGYIFAPSKNPRDVTLVSLDIKGAFLQGLRFDELTKLARKLRYEQRHKRDVYVIPPENVWRHFRAHSKPGNPLYIEDRYRALYILLCLACMYGFTDAPLLFQLALVHFLLDNTQAHKSVYDDNHLFWLDSNKQYLELTCTIHVDDILVAGTIVVIRWLQDKLESRFGKLKRQELPFTHTGLEYEMINPDCLFQHQSAFVSKLKMITVSKERRKELESSCTVTEHTEFRSSVCSSLWATITRQDVVSELNSLQSELQHPLVKHLLEANSVVRRLRQHNGADKKERFGLYYWRLNLPIRCLGITDASAANKKSNYAANLFNRYICICICAHMYGHPATLGQPGLRHSS